MVIDQERDQVVQKQNRFPSNPESILITFPLSASTFFGSRVELISPRPRHPAPLEPKAKTSSASVMRIASLPRFPKTQLRRKEWRNGGSSNEKSVHGWKSGPPTLDAILASNDDVEEEDDTAAADVEAAEAEEDGLGGGEGDLAMMAAIQLVGLGA